MSFPLSVLDILSASSSGAGAKSLHEVLRETYVGVENVGPLTSPASYNYYRYVDSGAPSGGNGSAALPYNTVQDAIDEIESLTLPLGTRTTIYLAPGVYQEALVFHKAQNFIVQSWQLEAYLDVAVVIDPPTDQWAVTLTNATQASLEAYDVSGVYSDLVNQGDAGIANIKFQGIEFRSSSAVAGPVRMLGVKGDSSPTTTLFGELISFANCLFTNTGAYPYLLYRKNSGTNFYTGCKMDGTMRCENSYIDYFSQCYLAPDFETVFDFTSVDGMYSAAFLMTIILEQSILNGKVDSSMIHDGIILNGSINAVNSSFSNLGSPKKISVENTVVNARGCSGVCDWDFDGGSDLEFYASIFTGRITLQSGPGTATWEGGGWVARLDDPDAKLSYEPTKKFTYPSTTTGPVTASIGERVRYDASGGTFQITAPLFSTTGASFAIKEVAGDATNITVDGNGLNIEHPVTGVRAPTAVIGVANISVTWESTDIGWIVV